MATYDEEKVKLVRGHSINGLSADQITKAENIPIEEVKKLLEVIAQESIKSSGEEQ